MAHLVPHAPSLASANGADRKLAQFLLAALPPSPGEHSLEEFRQQRSSFSYLVVPAVELPDLNFYRKVYVDCLVIAPHAVYVLESRDWGQQIEGDDAVWYIDGRRERVNPHTALAFKCRLIQSLLARFSPYLQQGVWVQGAVVVARPDAIVNLKGKCRWTTFRLDQSLIEYLQDPARLPAGQSVRSDAIESLQRPIADLFLRHGGPGRRREHSIAGHAVVETLVLQEGYGEYLILDPEDSTGTARKRLRIIHLPRSTNGSDTVEIGDLIRPGGEVLEDLGRTPFVVSLKEEYLRDQNCLVQVLGWGEEGTLRFKMTQETLTLTDTLALISQIATGLEAAHERGIIHGDLRPENVILTSSGARLVNFAREYAGAGTTWKPFPSAPQPPDNRYLAPELGSAEKRFRPGPAIDLFSLGAIFYELLCGDLPGWQAPEPFKGSGVIPEEMLPSRRFKELPVSLDVLVRRSYAARTSERYSDIRTFLRELKPHLQMLEKRGLPPRVAARPIPPSENRLIHGCPQDTEVEAAVPVQLPKPVESELDDAGLFAQARQVRKFPLKKLVNILNYLHFQGQTISLTLRHRKYGNTLSFELMPNPLLDGVLECRFVGNHDLEQTLSAYRIESLVVNDGRRLIRMRPQVKEMTPGAISFALPETCWEQNLRKVRRHPCQGVDVELVQHGLVLHGTLSDYCAVSFRTAVNTPYPQVQRWINPEAPTFIVLRRSGEVLFSGECRVVRHSPGCAASTVVLEPLNNQIQRFRAKRHRAHRHSPLPAPHMVFYHPLTGKLVTLEIDNLSGSGFSVLEEYEHSVLSTGLVLPEVEIAFGKDFSVSCKAQVVFRKHLHGGESSDTVRCGLAFLDINAADQIRLSSLLRRIEDRRSYVCSRVDLDELWKFFFEAGFVYPQKYQFLHGSKEDFKVAYERLYLQDSAIARHFLTQEKGAILAHLSMLRLYHNTWLFHHYAASGEKFKRAGLAVLDQVSRYVNDFAALPSTRLNHIMAYFRPENRFPDRLFGGFAKALKNPQGCSIDCFACFHLPQAADSAEFSKLEGDFRAGELRLADASDLAELAGFYNTVSGGLLLDATDLRPHLLKAEELDQEYAKLGLERKRLVYSVRKAGLLQAVFVVITSNVGLNLSHFTNCIHAIILDPDGFDPSAFYSSLLTMGRSSFPEKSQVPVMVFPSGYLHKYAIAYEKLYNLWIFNTQYGDQYFQYMEDNIYGEKHRDQDPPWGASE